MEKREIRELKPATKSGIAKGKRQLKRYDDYMHSVYGFRFKLILDLYAK